MKKESGKFHKNKYINEKLNSYLNELNQLIGERNIHTYLKIIDHSLSKNVKIIFYQDPKKGESPEKSKKGFYSRTL